jgi:hypothetical protein
MNSVTSPMSRDTLLNMIAPNPCVSKSDQLHVVIFRFFLYEFEVHSTYSLEIVGYLPQVLNFFSRFFLKLNWFICK